MWAEQQSHSVPVMVDYTARQGWYAKNRVHWGSYRILKDDMRISVAKNPEDVDSTIPPSNDSYHMLRAWRCCQSLLAEW